MNWKPLVKLEIGIGIDWHCPAWGIQWHRCYGYWTFGFWPFWLNIEYGPGTEAEDE